MRVEINDMARGKGVGNYMRGRKARIFKSEELE